MSPFLPSVLLQAQTDAQLLALSHRGSTQAFEVFVERHRDAVRRYARRLGLTADAAEDVAQQSLLIAWRSVHEGDEIADPRAWLFRVAHNAAIDVLRRRDDGHDELAETIEQPGRVEEIVQRRGAIREVLRGLAAMPAVQREAIMRSSVHGESREQVALALGISEGSVRGLVYRARATLRAAVTALTPSPLIQWAARTGGGADPQVTQRMIAVAGGGSAGATALALKAGAVAVTAAALVGGATLATLASRGGHAGRRGHLTRTDDYDGPATTAKTLARAPIGASTPSVDLLAGNVGGLLGPSSRHLTVVTLSGGPSVRRHSSAAGADRRPLAWIGPGDVPAGDTQVPIAIDLPSQQPWDDHRDGGEPAGSPEDGAGGRAWDPPGSGSGNDRTGAPGDGSAGWRGGAGYDNGGSGSEGSAGQGGSGDSGSVAGRRVSATSVTGQDGSAGSDQGSSTGPGRNGGESDGSAGPESGRWWGTGAQSARATGAAASSTSSGGPSPDSGAPGEGADG